MTPLYTPVPDMTYNVFGGTLSLTQSINLFTLSGSNDKLNAAHELRPYDAVAFI